MAAPRPAERPRFLLLVLVAAALTLLTLQFRGVEPLGAFQQGIRDILSPVRSIADQVTNPVQRVWNGIFEYGDLQGENERLQSELSRMRGESLTAKADGELLERLLGEVDIAYAELTTVVARIIGTPPGNFVIHAVEIDKGSDDGLEEGLPVITAAGLVGRLDQVDRARSVVQLATHPDFRVGVRLVESQDEGLARGTGEDDVLVVDAGIRPDTPISIGEVVITSGGRSLYPSDIPVGRVSDSGNDTEFPRSIIVQLAAGLENLSFLNVVVEAPGFGAAR